MSATALRRLAWTASAIAVALATVGLTLGSAFGALGAFGDEGSVVLTSLGAAVFLAFPIVGSLIAWRHPRHPIAYIFIAAGFVQGLSLFAFVYSSYALRVAPGSIRGGVVLAWVADVSWAVSLPLLTTFLLLLFPTGRLPSRRWRPVAWGALVAAILLAVSVALEPTLYAYPRIAAPLAPLGVPEVVVAVIGTVGFFGVLVGAVAALVSLFVRLRRSRGDEREQLKWFVYAALLLIAVELPISILEPESAWVQAVGAMTLLLLPASVAIAILKYRLYGIDVVIRRTLVAALLLAFITAVYLGIVVGVGALVGSRGNLFLSIVATALIALAFQPARERAGRFANRLVYGKRATPYEVMAAFAEGAAETYSLDEVLPRLAEAVASATGATRAGVWLRVSGELRKEASHPRDEGWPAAIPLGDDDLPDVLGVDATAPVRHRGEVLGAITVDMPPAEPLTGAHERLLADVASQAGLVLRNVRLLEDLRASRQRLVAAQDEERRRLERNIHDGAQQQLVALAVKLRLAETLADRDGAKAKALMAQAKTELQEALDDLRDLARGIYPPLLADQGLAAALEAQARKAAIPVEVHPDGVGRYPQEVEAGAYFCVLEALQNAAKYADASTVEVSLRQDDGHLVFEVRDDGRGFDPDRAAPGSGLTNMRDRLEALGGSLEVHSRPGQGTTVRGCVPAGEAA